MSYPQFLPVLQSNPYYQSPSQIVQIPPRSQPVPIPTSTYVSISSNTSTSTNAGPSGQATPFKAPAHKHAHHLHSIPPREKSTRTLIIDHLLWVHCRTRFAQARAELGMSDRTGGSSSPNYIHRERPENYEEEDETYSDGEDVSVLRTRSGWSQDAEDGRLTGQDLQLAISLRTRSESVEKVVNSMLNQPPTVHPLHPDDLADAQSSSKQNAHGTNSHPHALPNGVRLRIALATLINDFFARQTDLASTQTPTPYLPPAIVPFLPISACISSPDINSPHQSQAQHTHPHTTPSIRTRSLYTSGVDLSSTPTSRCSRHLYTACIVCNSSGGRPEHNGRSNSAFTTGVGGVTGWQDGSGIGSGLAKPAVQGNVLRREHGESTNMVELLIRFLRLSALVAMELGSEAVDDRSSADGNGMQWGDQQQPSSSPHKGKARAASGSGPSAPSSPTNHRFPKEVLKQAERERMQAYALLPSKEWYMLCAGLVTRAVLEGYMTYGWTGLCAVETLMKMGLGLGSTVMGANMGPRNNDRGVSQDTEEDPFAQFDPDDFPTLLESAKVLFPALKYKGFSSENVPRDGPEAEYEFEMDERLARFYDVPATAPDLSTHLEDLSWQHPTEPLERAALRFLEAIAKWRGKPELETYKKKPNRTASIGSSDIEGPLSIDLLVNSSPIASTLTIPPTGMKGPGIERYFIAPASRNIQPGVLGFGGGAKRRRESIVLDPAKRMRQGQMGDGAGMV